MKNIEAAHCPGTCAIGIGTPCGSVDCACYPVSLFYGFCISRFQLSSVAKIHPNLCESDEECKKKGSGNFCARYPNHYVDYGWCFNSGSDQLKGFLAMPRAISK